MDSRRGQGASSAAVLVALMGVVIIIYILTLSPDDRDALLQGSGAVSGGLGSGVGGAGSLQSVMLLQELPGTLNIRTNPVVKHSLAPTTVFTTVNTVALKEVSSLYVKNSMFSRNGAKLTFDTTRLRAGTYLLSFNVKSANAGPEGANLVIFLNGEEIFNEVITQKSPQPILLDEQLILEGQNEITMQVSGVGFMFWRANDYLLSNVLVSADVFDYSGATSEQNVVFSEQELSRMEKVSLQFVPECNARDAGRLIVEVNNVLTFSGYPECGIVNAFDIAPSQLAVGNNRVVFVSEQGSYLLDRIEVVSHLKESDYPVYYFQIPTQLYEPTNWGDAQLLLTMRFAEYRTVKRGEIVINGYVETFEAGEYVYQALIDPDIVLPGPNTVQIIPHVDRLDIAELKVELI